MTNVSKWATKEDDIRAFLPRSVRNVENAEARMRAALKAIENQKQFVSDFFF